MIKITANTSLVVDQGKFPLFQMSLKGKHCKNTVSNLGKIQATIITGYVKMMCRFTNILCSACQK